MEREENGVGLEREKKDGRIIVNRQGMQMRRWAIEKKRMGGGEGRGEIKKRGKKYWQRRKKRIYVKKKRMKTQIEETYE